LGSTAVHLQGVGRRGQTKKERKIIFIAVNIMAEKTT
jgi:hypothetical protein